MIAQFLIGDKFFKIEIPQEHGGLIRVYQLLIVQLTFLMHLCHNYSIESKHLIKSLAFSRLFNLVTTKPHL